MLQARWIDVKIAQMTDSGGDRGDSPTQSRGDSPTHSRGDSPAQSGIPISMLLCENEEQTERGGPSSSGGGSHRAKPRPRWRPEEDLKLRELMEAAGGKQNWSELAEHLGKTGKQVRLRWVDHLSPEIDKRPWTEKEDKQLLRGHARYGNSWSRIAKVLPGRSDAMTKNRYYQLTRKRSSKNEEGESS